MNVQVFDTHVRTTDGGYLHFDVLIESNDPALAARYARDWLTTRGIAQADVSQSRCQFCHSEAAHPDVAGAIAQQGYYIIAVQG